MSTLLYIKEKAEGKADAKFHWNYDLKPVTVVAILNFSFEHSDDWPPCRYHSSYRLREDYNQEIMTDVLRFVFLELGRFKKKIWELENDFDKWMYLLLHIHEMEDIPSKFNDPLFTRLFMLAEISKFTPEEKKQYDKSIENMGDYLNTITTAVEDAKAVGKAEGVELAKVAINMLKDGTAIDQICKETGLTEAQVADLQTLL